MNHKLKVIASIIGISAASLGFCYNVSMADNAPPINSNGGTAPIAKWGAPPPPLAEQMKMTDKQRRMTIEMARRHCQPPSNLGLAHNKHLTTKDARTIVDAALLMRGRHDLQVGTVNLLPTPKEAAPPTQSAIPVMKRPPIYLITIVNDKNTVISRVVMNSGTGMIHSPYPRRMPPEKQRR